MYVKSKNIFFFHRTKGDFFILRIPNAMIEAPLELSQGLNQLVVLIFLAKQTNLNNS